MARTSTPSAIRRRTATVLVTAAAMAVALPAVADAATLTVNTEADSVANDGACSLREAVTAANLNTPSGGASGECNAGSGPDVVEIPSGRFTVTRTNLDDANAGGDYDITTQVTLRGRGAGDTTIDAAGVDRVIDVRPSGTATVEGLTVTGGHASDGGDGGDATAGDGGDGGDSNTLSAGGTGGTGGLATGGSGGPGADGGGIRNEGTLTITSARVTANAAGNGGNGGFGSGGDGGNGGNNTGPGNGGNGGLGNNGTGGNGASGGRGGAIYSTGPLTLVNTSITGNRAGSGGAGGDGIGGRGGNGGAGVNGGAGAGAGSAVGGNGGTGGLAGGIHAVAGSPFSVTGSTIAGNSAGRGGKGGAATAGGGGNGGGGSAFAGAGGAGAGAVSGAGGNGNDGGGVYRPGLPQNYTNSTLAGNNAGDGGQAGTANGGRGGDGGTGSGSGDGGNGGSGGPATSGGGGSAGDGGALDIDNATLIHVTVAFNRPGNAAAGGPASGGGAGAAGTGSPSGSGGSPGSSTPGPAGSAGTGGGLRSGGNVLLRNTVVADNSTSNCAGATTDGGGALTFPGGSCAGAQGNPLLLPLGDYDGPTQTVALAPGSAARDAVTANCAAADQRGYTRPQGSACDIGAYEASAPLATTGAAAGVTATSATLTGTVTPNNRAASVRFEYGTTTTYGSTSPPREEGRGTSSSDVSETVAGLLPTTTYHYRLVATTADGTAFGEDRTFITPAAPPPGNARPVFGSLSLTNRVFAVAARNTPVSARAKLGTRLRYTLSEAATVRIQAQRAQAGRRRGRSCVKPTRKLRRAKRCTRYVTKMTLTRKEAAGANSVRFTGRVRGKRLRAGRHRFRLRATDAQGARSRYRSVGFRVVRR